MSVNAQIIAIAEKVYTSWYPGRSKAMSKASTQIIIPKKILSDNTFPIIFSFGTFPLEISLIAMVYRPRSAKNAKIQR